MKICGKCKQNKNDGDFYVKTKTTLSSYCKSCFNTYCIERWEQRKIFFVKEMGNCCECCGLAYDNSNLSLFEFHHIDPKEKKFVWTKLRLKSESKIREELEKCQLLCANCHRLKHWKTKLVPNAGIEPTNIA